MQKVLYRHDFLPIPQLYKDLCKRNECPLENVVSHVGFPWTLVTLYFHEIASLTPLLYAYVAASITMAAPFHHHLKLNGATPRTRRPLFWVTTPLRTTPNCKHRERGDTWNSRQMNSLASIYLTCQTIPRLLAILSYPYTLLWAVPTSKGQKQNCGIIFCFRNIYFFTF